MSRKRNRSNRPRPGKPGPDVRPADVPAARAGADDRREALPEARAKLGKAPPARAPVFWFGFELPWAKLAIARVVLFGLLAVDAFLQLRHAPRYGAGDFNVAHVPLLESLGPGRLGYEVGQLVLAYLFALAALGVATRLVLPIAAAGYAWLYFGSQLDSYQHHYLVAILVAIACFVPWQRPADAAPSTRVRSWAIRLILVQLGIMYLWAAISKLDPAWASGRTLAGQLTGSLRSFLDHTAGVQAAAIAVIGIELVLAATIWLRPAWRLAAPLGILFHLGIAMSGLEIGVFAYLMLGLYVLVIPDAFFEWLAETPPVRAIRRPLHRLAAAASWPAWAIAIGAGVGLGALVRLEHALPAAIAVSAIPVALAVRARLRGARPGAALAAAHLAALALWVGADRASSVAEDYYKFWGGSQRRLGELADAEHAYRRLVEVAPDLELGHYYLGRILTADGRGEQGLVHLREAQRLAPRRARAWIEEARWLAAQGQHEAALAKARQAAFAEPSNGDARVLLERLLADQPAPPPPAEDDLEKL